MAVNVTREEFELLERRLRRNTSRLYEDLNGTSLHLEQVEGDPTVYHENPTVMTPYYDIDEIPMGTILYFRSNTNTPTGDTQGTFTIMFTDPLDDSVGIPYETTYLGELRNNRVYALTLTTENEVRIVEFHDGALAADVNELLLHKDNVTSNLSVIDGTLTASGGDQAFAANEFKGNKGTFTTDVDVGNILTAEYITLPPGGYARVSIGDDDSGIVTDSLLTDKVDVAVEAALEDKIRIDSRTPTQYEQDTEQSLPNGVLYFQVNQSVE